MNIRDLVLHGVDVRRLGLVLLTALLLAASWAPRPAYADFISLSATLHNDGDLPLRRVGGQLDHGCWGQEPPLEVPAHASVTWRAESCDLSVLTGTEGYVRYAPFGVDAAHHATFSWNIPTIGDNEGGVSAPDGCTSSRSGPPTDGNNVSATYRIACNASTDDGIPDVWKKKGVSWTINNATVFVDLPAMGAEVGKRDVFVHMEWMENAATGFSTALRPQAIKNVVDAFAARGIRLHVDAGPNSALAFGPGAGTTWGGLSRAKARPFQAQLGTTGLDGSGNLTYNWTAFNNLKALPDGFTSTGRDRIFHYTIVASQLGTANNSGVGRTPGTDFIISLGTFTGGVGSLEEQTGTFMHELGHNLGLDHGGGDGANFKPNYPSVMNYAWQLTGVMKNGSLGTWDFSRGTVAAFGEANFDETIGLGPSAGSFGTQHFCPAASGAPAARITLANANGPVDWNCDGDAVDVAPPSFDVNSDPSAAGMISTFLDYDDWGRLRLKAGSIGNFGASVPTPPVVTPLESITSDQARQILPPDATAPTSTAQAAPAPNAAGWNNTAVLVTLRATDNDGGSGVARIEYNLDNAGWSIYTAPVLVATDAVHALQYRAVDRATNVEAAKSLTVRVDKTPPVVTFGGNQGVYSILDTVTITCGATDALSGVASTTCAAITGPAYDFAPGSNAFSASATDVAGNVGQGTTSFELRVTYADLCTLTRRWVTNAGVRRSQDLCAQLEAAERAEARGNARAKSQVLAAYVRDLEAAVRGGFLPADRAAILRKLVAGL